MRDEIANVEGAVCLEKVSALHKSSFSSIFGARRDWFKAQVVFTSDPIFVFGGGMKFSLDNQFYSKLHSPPEKLVTRDKGFIAVDDIGLDGNSLVIDYTSPHWHGAKCQLELRDIMQSGRSEPIVEILRQGFGIEKS